MAARVGLTDDRQNPGLQPKPLVIAPADTG